MGRPPNSKNKPKNVETATAERSDDMIDQPTSKGDVAIFQPARLPYHPAIEERFGLDKGTWKVLVEAIFPAAKSVDSIVMALSYCKSRGLDIMKRPVHIVPMWDSARGAMVETVWPGISELRTTASRTKGYAGCDEAQFGEIITEKFTGRVKRDGAWKEEAVEVSFPEWCRITVYRIVDGQRCKFVGPKVAWLETYATQGNSGLPNKMWQERPEGQLEKCAEAGALRRAFPEEIGNDLTAEEMIGRNIHDLAVDIPHVDQASPATAASRDTGPPRALPAAEPPAIEAEDVRDGDPPPREAKPEPKQDPISSGPPRKPATSGDNPVTEIKMAKPAAEPGPKPHRIPGAGHTFESWAEKFSDLVKTSEDTATVFKWIDENSRNFTTPDAPTPQKGPLERLKEKKPSVYSDVRKTIEATMESLRDAQQKSAEKASKKAAAKGDMDDEPAKPGQSVSSSSQITPQNPDDILAIIEQELAAVDDPDNLQEVWERVCDPLVEKLDFPPDKDLAQGIFSKHEKRLGGD